MVSPRSVVARYKAGKTQAPAALEAIDFPQFLRKIKNLTDQERDARDEYRQTSIKVQREIAEFSKLFRDLPREFEAAWRMVFSAGKNHGEDPRITDLLIQLNEAQRAYEDASRSLYGTL